MFASFAKGGACLGIAIALLWAPLVWGGVADEANIPLVLGLISPRSAEETQKNWQPMADRLSKAVGRKVDINIYQKQGDIVQDFLEDKVDVAWMGNSPALSVVEAGVGSIFAQMVLLDGNVGYRSIFVVHKSSDLRTLDDVLRRAKALTFSYGDSKSTSGNLVPSYYAFQRNGVENVAQTFQRVESGSHQENLNKVAERSIDVAVANDVELDFFSTDHRDRAAQLRVVWVSPLIPQSPMILRDKLSARLKYKIENFFVGFGKDAEEKKILLAVNGLSKFRKSSNRQLVPIADLEMFKVRRAISSDSTLTPAQRDEKIRAAIERGSRLELVLKLGRESASK